MLKSTVAEHFQRFHEANPAPRIAWPGRMRDRLSTPMMFGGQHLSQPACRRVDEAEPIGIAAAARRLARATCLQAVDPSYRAFPTAKSGHIAPLSDISAGKAIAHQQVSVKHYRPARAPSLATTRHLSQSKTRELTVGYITAARNAYSVAFRLEFASPNAAVPRAPDRLRC